MICFDVNILIYGHRSDQPTHKFYRDYLSARVNSGEPFALSSLAVGGFVRIVTSPRSFKGPTPLAQALATIENMTTFENCHWIHPGPRHWQIMSDLCRKTKATGKLVADAQHAALAIEHACTWATRDRDFEQFKQHGLQLEIIEP